MDIEWTQNGASGVLRLRGRLDATSVGTLERDWFAAGVSHLTVDLGRCEYVSSAGIRGFLRLHRDAAARGATLSFTQVGSNVYEVLDLTGLTRLLDIRRRPREISLDGLEFLSAGLCGECFRLDDETVVKLYNDGVAPEVAAQEKEFARAAFIAGVPTALSYDIVTCGSRTGVVYEMLNAKQFSTVIRETPDQIASHGQMLAKVAESFHTKVADPAVFPDLKARVRSQIDGLRGDITDDDVSLLQARLAVIPEADTLVHYDLHSSNIMIRDGEPIVIDMGDVSRGHYLFDLGLLATIYAYPDTGSSAFVTRVPDELGRQLYDHCLDTYFADKPAEERDFFERNEAFLASLRLISAFAFLVPSRDILRPKIRDYFLPRIRAAVEPQ